jgi:IscR-regulated protein YhgI
MNDELSYSFKGKDGGRIRITVEPSPTHANISRFVVEPPIYPEGAVHFSSEDEVQGSPLAESLFELADIQELVVAGGTVTVTTEAPVDWAEYSAEIATRLRDQLNSGVAPIAEEITKNLPSSESLRERVQEVIDTAVNPAVAAHGGVVNLLDVDHNTVYLEFGGGCQGCGMVSVTLKYGVERLLRERIPEIGQVLDTTDHAAGDNPYYAPAAK